MTAPAVFWMAFLGVAVLVAGVITYRRVLAGAGGAFAFVVLGPVFVAASLAAFAGEHFTAAASLATIVPAWMPGRLFIAYFVGVAHLAAALSFVARRYMRWSAPLLALMFALFVLLMDLPGALARPDVRISWSLAARETTYAVGALALWSMVSWHSRPALARRVATVARLWTAFVLVFYGIEHLLFPQFWPGVPDVTPTAPWVPAPILIAHLTGILLVVSGLAMLVPTYATIGAALTGLWLTALTALLYVPQFFLVHGVGEWVNALNFVFDTLLFAGTVLVIGAALSNAEAAAGVVAPDGVAPGRADRPASVTAA